MMLGSEEVIVHYLVVEQKRNIKLGFGDSYGGNV